MTIKIKPKQFAGFKRALCAPGFNGISANDGYNKQEFGVTFEQYTALRLCAEGMLGMDARQVTLKMVNDYLAGEKVALTRATNELVERVQKAFG